MNSISNVSSQHIVNALQLSNLMSFANLLYKFWIIFNVIIKDNKTRLCFVINLRCLTHVFCTTENNIKYVFLVFSEKIKFLIKTYTVRVFFVLFLLSSYAVQSSRIPGILHSKRHTITCVFRGSPYFSEMTFIYLQGTVSFRTISYPKPRKA